jgi:hypothetical protein
MASKKRLKDFVVFIISHGRSDNVKTEKTLRFCGYTGPIYIVIDDLDKTRDAYVETFGADRVIVFDKAAIAKTTDQGDNFSDLRTTTHVRNATFQIARELGYKYFVQLDDDYVSFRCNFNRTLDYEVVTIRNLDLIFEKMLNFFKSAKSVLSIAMSQGGDFIGGRDSPLGQSIIMKRKAMNSFICSTEREFKFFSRLNEDVNTYLALGHRGHLFFTTSQVRLEQTTTQSSTGGMTEAYLRDGTYVKSFYSVMYHPSAVKIRAFHGSRTRIHYTVAWRNAVPLIVRESFKKKLDAVG